MKVRLLARKDLASTKKPLNFSVRKGDRLVLENEGQILAFCSQFKIGPKSDAKLTSEAAERVLLDVISRNPATFGEKEATAAKAKIDEEVARAAAPAPPELSEVKATEDADIIPSRPEVVAPDKPKPPVKDEKPAPDKVN